MSAIIALIIAAIAIITLAVLIDWFLAAWQQPDNGYTTMDTLNALDHHELKYSDHKALTPDATPAKSAGEPNAGVVVEKPMTAAEHNAFPKGRW